MSMENEILVLSGTANPKLAEDVVKNMNLKLGDMEIRRFADGEVLFISEWFKRKLFLTAG